MSPNVEVLYRAFFDELGSIEKEAMEKQAIFGIPGVGAGAQQAGSPVLRAMQAGIKAHPATQTMNFMKNTLQGPGGAIKGIGGAVKGIGGVLRPSA